MADEQVSPSPASVAKPRSGDPVAGHPGFAGTGARSARVEEWSAGEGCECRDWLAEEQPVDLRYRCVSHAVMLATPGDLEDFALGFSLSEGIIEHPRQLYDVQWREVSGGIELQMDLASECFARLQARRRALVGASGCGLCGLTSLAAVLETLPPLPERLRFQPEVLQRALNELPCRQELGRLTGGTHAAAWCDSEGSIRLVREDVGRHNALDKLIGALAYSGETRPPGFALLSSRASFELVQKAVRTGMEVLVTVSAASSAAVDLAERSGLTLVGFARPGRHVVYSHSWRLIPASVPVSGQAGAA